MSHPQKRIGAAEASRQLGVSAKALRLYEERGLLRPARSDAGYRLYGSEDLERGRDIVALRGLGLSLAQVSRALSGERNELAVALDARQTQLEAEFRAVQDAIARVRALRMGLQLGQPLTAVDLTGALRPTGISVSFALPWPWDGEDFRLDDIRRITYLVGPLGSGKTRLALRFAEALGNSVYLAQDERASPDAALDACMPQEMAWLLDEGAHDSPALRTLVSALEADGGHRPLIVEMVEEGLDQQTQEALMQYLRKRARPGGAPVFLMTRSSSILDLALVGPDETILLCPANHAVPRVVAPYAGAAGYEAIETCLGTPRARARLAAGSPARA